MVGHHQMQRCLENLFRGKTQLLPSLSRELSSAPPISCAMIGWRQDDLVILGRETYWGRVVGGRGGVLKQSWREKDKRRRGLIYVSNKEHKEACGQHGAQ